MKFLIVGKPGGSPLPPEKALEANRAAHAHGKKLLEGGTHDCAYAFFGGGGLAITNADSADEVFKILMSYPMYSQFIWEVTPLLDWDKTFTTIFKLYE